MNTPILDAMRVLTAFPSFEKMIDAVKMELEMKTNKQLADFLNIVPQKLAGRVHKCNGGFLWRMMGEIVENKK